MSPQSGRDFRAHVERLAAADRLGDALEALLAVSDGRSAYRNEVLGHLAELHRISRSERLNAGGAQTAIDRRRLTQAILELLGTILRDTAVARLPAQQEPVSLALPDDISLEKIIGANNLKNISWLQVGLRCAQSVGRVVTPAGVGTGFKCSGNRLVTNHHVLPSVALVNQSFVEFNYQCDEHGQLLDYFTYELDGRQFRTDRDKDVTIVGLVQHPGSPSLDTWGSLTLEFSKQPQVGDHVSIIQHANGGPKQIACTANQVVNLFEHRLQYLTDTMPGSSGAPVFDDDWKVVAIHHAGGDLKVNKRGDTRFVNEGILVGDVVTLLQAS